MGTVWAFRKTSLLQNIKEIEGGLFSLVQFCMQRQKGKPKGGPFALF